MLARPAVLLISIQDIPASHSSSLFATKSDAHLRHFHAFAHSSHLPTGFLAGKYPGCLPAEEGHQERSLNSSTFTLTSSAATVPTRRTLRVPAFSHLGASGVLSHTDHGKRITEHTAKSCRINTYKSVTKQRTYSGHKPFRINTYKNAGEGVCVWDSRANPLWRSHL